MCISKVDEMGFKNRNINHVDGAKVTTTFAIDTKMHMKVNDELVDGVARLAKLTFEGEAKEAIKKDLTKILDFVEKLNEVDTEGVEPLEYMVDEELELRLDQSENTISRADALKNAPLKDSDYFKVPKVLSK